MFWEHAFQPSEGGLAPSTIQGVCWSGHSAYWLQGFAAICVATGDSLHVPSACKSRGFCPSCMGRRMVETAVLPVEHRLPAVRWRQRVLSLPGPPSVRLDYDRACSAGCVRVLATRVMQMLRRLTKRAHGLTSSSPPGVA